MSRFVTRAESGLKPPTGAYSTIRPEGVTAHHGGPSPWGSDVDRSSPTAFARSASHRRCASIWRAWQAFHQSKNWIDIAYTSGPCPHGERFEGRPTTARTAAQGTNDGNRRSLAVCYIAGAGDPLTDAAKLAFHAESRRLGVALRWPHNYWHPTECPGPLVPWIRAGWPLPSAPVAASKESDMFLFRTGDHWFLAFPDRIAVHMHTIEEVDDLIRTGMPACDPAPSIAAAFKLVQPSDARPV